MNKIVKGLKAPSHSGKRWGIKSSPKSNQIKTWGCMCAEKNDDEWIRNRKEPSEQSKGRAYDFVLFT